MSTDTEPQGKIAVLYILICMFLDSTQVDKRSWAECLQVLPEFNSLLISSGLKFWFVTILPKYMNCAHIQKIYYLSYCYDFALHSADAVFCV
jgi:hypothetical protein